MTVLKIRLSGTKKTILNKLKKKNIKLLFKNKRKLRVLQKKYRKKLFFGGQKFIGLFKKNRKNLPLISIIMPNYKSKTLEKSIKSVLNQKYQNIELIVIDGNSGSSTIKLLKKYNTNIDLWLSENDNGLWDAWNKGFREATGKFVGIVDSSNILYPNAISILVNYINSNNNIDFICGTIKKDGRLYGGYNPKEIYKKFNIIPSSVVGFYIKNSSLKKVGLLNLKYKIQSDYDLLYRMIVKSKLRGIHTKGNEIFGDLGSSGLSAKHNFFKLLKNEIRIRYDNGQNLLILIYIIIGRSITKLFNLK